MTLTVSVVQMDETTGRAIKAEMLEGAHGVVGFESTRTDLWGSQALVDLGARFLPRLREENLLVENEQLEEFRRELELLMANTEAISRQCPYESEYISVRLRNLQRATFLAKQRGGAVLVD